MAGTASKCFFLFLFSLLSICSQVFNTSDRISCALAEGFAPMEVLSPKKMKWKEEAELQSSTIIFPTIPETSTPTIVTVPTTNPVTVLPTSPWATPTTVPGGQPISNPVTTYPTIPITNPVSSSPVVSSPAVSRQSWCVAKIGTLQTLLQAALDYACGNGGSDCSPIQQGGSCFFPNTLENHASFAFNSYFQRNPVVTSCDFGGTAAIVNTDPSSGSCIYPLLSSSPSQSSPPSLPATTNPVPTPTPTTVLPPPTPLTTSPPSSGAFSFGSSPTPTALNTSNPASGSGTTTTTTGFGSESPPASLSSSAAASSYGGFMLVGVPLLVISFLQQAQIFLES